MNIKLEDTQTYVEQLKKDNDIEKTTEFKKALDDYTNQYKIYDLEYASPDILKELNLIQKKEFFLKELKKYMLTVNDSTMKKNCKKFIVDIETMPLLSLDSPSSPSKPPSIATNAITTNAITTNAINVDISNNNDANSVPVITPAPPTVEPPSFASPKKQSQSKANTNIDSNAVTTESNGVIVTEVVEADVFDEIVAGFNEELDYVENVEYDEDFVAEEAEEEEIRKPEAA